MQSEPEGQPHSEPRRTPWLIVVGVALLALAVMIAILPTAAGVDRPDNLQGVMGSQESAFERALSKLDVIRQTAVMSPDDRFELDRVYLELETILEVMASDGSTSKTTTPEAATTISLITALLGLVAAVAGIVAAFRSATSARAKRMKRAD